MSLCKFNIADEKPICNFKICFWRCQPMILQAYRRRIATHLKCLFRSSVDLFYGNVIYPSIFTQQVAGGVCEGEPEAVSLTSTGPGSTGASAVRVRGPLSAGRSSDGEEPQGPPGAHSAFSHRPHRCSMANCGKVNAHIANKHSLVVVNGEGNAQSARGIGGRHSVSPR